MLKADGGLSSLRLDCYLFAPHEEKNRQCNVNDPFQKKDPAWTQLVKDDAAAEKKKDHTDLGRGV